MDAERLKRKARDYELSAQAQRDAGGSQAANVFAAVAIVLYEIAGEVMADACFEDDEGREAA